MLVYESLLCVSLGLFLAQDSAGLRLVVALCRLGTVDAGLQVCWRYGLLCGGGLG